MIEESLAGKQLFNGRDMDGWEHVGPGRFVIDDGRLKSEGGMGLLWYTREAFGDCVLRVVYMTTAPDTNSGVFIRIDGPPADEWHAVHHGYEVQIQDALDDYHRTGAIYSLAPAISKPMNPPDEWNVMDIAMEGQRVRVSINGTLVTDFHSDQPVPERHKDWEPERGPRPSCGYIGVQNHDGNQTVYFREISIHPL